MQTEYEATFLDIDRAELTKKLRALGAVLERPEYMQRRVTLELPEGKRELHTWLRVRDEGDKITLTLKSVDGKTIAGQKEILTTVGDFENTVSLLEAIGCERKSYQESNLPSLSWRPAYRNDFPGNHSAGRCYGGTWCRGASQHSAR